MDKFFKLKLTVLALPNQHCQDPYPGRVTALVMEHIITVTTQTAVPK